ncbi:receptor-like protein 7 [Malus domestica]|uniref:receptor-like protein 7 n=1 Tax=Malus domestica TaxID=3750 RepID=UPI003975FA2C
MPDAFNDAVKVTKSHIPTANAPARIDVPVGQNKVAANDLSCACLKRGRPPVQTPPGVNPVVTNGYAQESAMRKMRLQDIKHDSLHKVFHKDLELIIRRHTFLFHTFVVSSQCPGDQQSLLLQLKSNLTFDPATSKKLMKWNNGSDYCSWEGVSCKKSCVSNLDLSSEVITGGLDNSSSLFGLKSIENLNLAYNFFNNTQIPSEFKQLTGLSNLNMSNAGFVGQVPIEISHLTRLNFSKLAELYLDGVRISAQGTEWCQAISSSLPNLRVLSLSTCNLSVVRIENNNLSTQVPEFFSKFSNLTSLLLRNTVLYGAFPKKIFQVPTLQTIDLSGNQQLQGFLPEFPKNASLRSLVLSGANFLGLLPNSIGNLKMLSKIDISRCNFTGSIPRSIGDVTPRS